MKTLRELTNDELKVVFKKNDHLQHEVFNAMMDDAHYFNCEEILPCWKRNAIDYAIGYDRGAYFQARDKELFISGLQNAQRSFCFLADEYDDSIADAAMLVLRLKYGRDISEADEEAMEEQLDGIIEKLESACFERFMDEYRVCFEDDNLFDYFLNSYIETMTEECYVDDDYILYEEVSYTKCYK